MRTVQTGGAGWETDNRQREEWNGEYQGDWGGWARDVYFGRSENGPPDRSRLGCVSGIMDPKERRASIFEIMMKLTVTKRCRIERALRPLGFPTEIESYAIAKVEIPRIFKQPKSESRKSRDCVKSTKANVEHKGKKSIAREKESAYRKWNGPIY